MNNYKIKVKDEAESKEAQELFFELGCEWRDSKKDITNLDDAYIYADDGILTFGFNDFNFRGSENKELTLPQLRDLVVLKRNDINDANWETEGGDQIYKDSSDKSYIYRSDGWDELQRHEMRQAMWEKPKAIIKSKDQGLISGADAKLAWANGQDVQTATLPILHEQSCWINLPGGFGLDVFDDSKDRVFRLKPQTTKLELEIPTPFEPKEGDEYFYISTFHHCSYSHDVWSGEPADITQAAFGAYRTEDDVKKAVEQLRKIRGAS